MEPVTIIVAVLLAAAVLYVGIGVLAGGRFSLGNLRDLNQLSDSVRRGDTRGGRLRAENAEEIERIRTEAEAALNAARERAATDMDRARRELDLARSRMDNERAAARSRRSTAARSSTAALVPTPRRTATRTPTPPPEEDKQPGWFELMMDDDEEGTG